MPNDPLLAVEIARALKQVYADRADRPVDTVVLAHAENIPTRILRHVILGRAAGNARARYLTGLLRHRGVKETEAQTQAARILNTRTALIFFDGWPESGIPENFEYPSASFSTRPFPRGYTGNQFYIELLGSYELGGYFKLPALTGDGAWTEAHTCEFLEGVCSLAGRTRYGHETEKTLSIRLDKIVEDVQRVKIATYQVLGENWLDSPMTEQSYATNNDRPSTPNLRIHPIFGRVRSREYRRRFGLLLEESETATTPPGLVSFFRMMSIADKIGKRRFESNVYRAQNIVAFRNNTEKLWEYLGAEYSDEFSGEVSSFLDVLGVADGVRALLNAAYRRSASGNLDVSNEIKAAIFDLQRVEHAIQLVRDAARLVGQGACHWLRVHNQAALRVLIIDDTIGGENAGDKQTSSLLLAIFKAIDSDGTMLTVDVCDDAFGLQGDGKTVDKHSTYSLQDRDNYLGNVPKRASRFFPPLDKDPSGISNKLMDYDLILIEFDYRQTYIGPRVIHWLTSFIDRQVEVELQNQKYEKPSHRRLDRGPAVLALTRDDKFGNIHQSMSLGANSFVSKDRLFQLPSRMKRACVARRSRAERTGERSNFRILYQMMPDERARLRASDEMITGRLPWSDQTDAAELLPGQYFPISQERWIRSLPKADLHCHFGTSIGLPMTVLLAYNTVGYLISSISEADIAEHHGPIGNLARRLCEIVYNANLAQAGVHPKFGKDNNSLTAIDYLALVSNISLKGPAPYYKVVEKVDEANRAKGDPMHDYETTALLIVAVDCMRRLCKAGEPQPTDAMLKKTVNHLTDLDNQQRSNPFVQPVLDKLRRMMRSDGWHGQLTENEMTGNLTEESSSFRLAASFNHLAARFKLRHERAKDYITTILEAIIADAHRTPKCAPITLENLVKIPDIRSRDSQDRTGSLLHYLRGCEFLGSDHLQYPDNLVLAAMDFVRLNAEQGVIYAEVRAEINGYAKAGMSPADATDLLCRAFDMASLWQRNQKVDMGNGEKPSPFVRVNLLIAAKRHKGKDKARQAIDLARRFLTQPPPELTPVQRNSVPAWWQPARVVGFDMSGNEAENLENPDELLGMLKDISAHITIHAGEASSAESIWSAVYQLAARRIGHGLKLREKDTLLQYCVDEGICMEMCPISNNFTNYFEEIAVVDRRLQSGKVYERRGYNGSNPYQYPLKHYVERGLSVCINTDNRALHPIGMDSIVADYLMAARLSGGLTKWEVLGLVKAGFRHAFLPKTEIAILLDAVEDRVYSQWRG